MADVYVPQPVRTLNPGDVKEIMVDATTTSQGAKVDASGNQYVMVSNTTSNPVPITGGNTSAVNTQDAADGPVTPGTAATKSILVGGQYNSTLPTLTTAQQSAVQLDASGRLLVSQPTASALNATVVSPTAANFNATIVQATAANLNALVAQGAKGTLAQAWYVQGTDGTNTQAYLATGEAKVSVTQPLPAGTNLLGSVNQGTSPWIVKDQADGSVTGGTAGSFSMLSGGIYNSSAPTLTTGQQASLQLDASGNLKVSLAADPVSVINTSDAADGPVTPGTVASKSILAGVQYNSTLPTLTTGQQAAVQADSSGRLLVSSIANALPAGTNLLGGATVYVGSSAASNSNPVPVTITNTPTGTVVNKYNTSVALAAAAVANHVYTITTSKTFTGRKFWASGSGKIRADIQTSPDGTTYTTFWTGFSSPIQPNIDIQLDTLSIQDSGTGSTIRIQITNEDNQAFDVFSTISGQEN